MEQLLNYLPFLVLGLVLILIFKNINYNKGHSTINTIIDQECEIDIDSSKESTTVIISQDTAVDPVCGMHVPKKSAVYKKHQDQEYYFCSIQCANYFEKSMKHKAV